MLILIISVSVVLLIFLGLVLFARLAFRIEQIPHDRTPAEFDIPFEEIEFTTENDRRLYGWWVPSADGNVATAPTLILVHGWKRNVGRMLTYIHHLYPGNFNMLAFDARHHGSSDPDGYSSMVKFAQDTLHAVKFVSGKGIDPQRVGLVGLSLGGGASILASSWEPAIKMVVSVGAPAHPGDIIRFDMQQRGIPYFPLVWFMLKYFERILGFSLDEIAPANVIPKTNAQYLVIHGDRDDVVPLEHGQRLKAAGQERVTFWLLPDKAHSDCHRSENFWPKLQAYIHQTL